MTEKDMRNLPIRGLLDEGVKNYLEGYAKACSDIMYEVSGEAPCAKSYDPLTIEGTTLHSYAFEFKDGGRHHDGLLYTYIGDIMDDMLEESISWITD